jgi:hypothetical protein
MKFSGLLSYVPPTKLVSDYNESEKQQFQKAFEPRARDSRLCKYANFGLFTLAVALIFISNKREQNYLFIGIIGVFLTLYFLFRPVCPACKRNMDAPVRGYCPECGSNKILPGSFLRSPECLSCGEVSRQGKNGRRYKVRYCTHCGVFLHSKGI